MSLRAGRDTGEDRNNSDGGPVGQLGAGSRTPVDRLGLPLCPTQMLDWIQPIQREGSSMSDHFDLLDPLAPDPEMAPLDIGDLYAFQSPGDPTRSALILTVNPLTLGAAFDPNAVYRINVDTDGDAVADLAFSVVFSPLEGGRQRATVYRATGNDYNVLWGIGTDGVGGVWGCR